MNYKYFAAHSLLLLLINLLFDKTHREILIVMNVVSLTLSALVVIGPILKYLILQNQFFFVKSIEGLVGGKASKVTYKPDWIGLAMVAISAFALFMFAKYNYASLANSTSFTDYTNNISDFLRGTSTVR